MFLQVRILCVCANISARVLFTCGFHHKRLLLWRNFTCKSFFGVKFQKFPILFSSSLSFQQTVFLDIGFPKSRVGVNILGVVLNQFPNRGLVTTLEKPKKMSSFAVRLLFLVKLSTPSASLMSPAGKLHVSDVDVLAQVKLTDYEMTCNRRYRR